MLFTSVYVESRLVPLSLFALPVLLSWFPSPIPAFFFPPIFRMSSCRECVHICRWNRLNRRYHRAYFLHDFLSCFFFFFFFFLAVEPKKHTNKTCIWCMCLHGNHTEEANLMQLLVCIFAQRKTPILNFIL